MTDRPNFEARLAERLGLHTEGVVRPFDAAAISASAARTAGSGSRWALPRAGIKRARHLVPTLVWLAIVALLLAVVGASLLTGGRPPLPAVVQETSSPTPSSSAPVIAILPGDRWIVYPSPSGSATGTGLILVREDGTDRHEILQLPDGRREHPDWSRDGSQLAFETWHRDTARPGLDLIDVWISDADGGHARQVARCESPCLQRAWPAWSPDGSELALIRYDRLPGEAWGRSAVEILDLATGKIRVVAETQSGVSAYYTPRWSADGTRIVFTIETYLDAAETTIISSSLAVVRADGSDGSRPRILTPSDLLVRFPDWHPTDDRIVFEANTSEAPTTSDLYTIQADGSGLVNLTNLVGTGNSASTPTWTPDGQRIAYSMSAASVRTAAFIDPDGSNPIRVSFDPAADPRLRPTP